MGDTLSCTATDNASDLASYDPSFAFESSTKQVCEAKPRSPFQANNALFTPSTPATYKSSDPSALVCRGEFKDLDEYLKRMESSARVSALGSYVASLPSSPEERIPTDVKVKIVAGQSYPLTQVWKGLPAQLRVYLDSMGFKGAMDLAIAFEGANAATGAPAQWHIMMSTAQQPGANGSPTKPPLSVINGGGGSPSPTPPEPTFNVSIGTTIVGVGLVAGLVAFDQAVIRKKFPNMPKEFMLPMNLGTLYGINYILYKGGLIQAASWGNVWKPMTNQLPFLATLGMLTSVLLDRAGAVTGADTFRFGHLGNDLGAPLITLGAYYTILGSRTLSPLAQGLINGGRFSFAAPAGGAGVLGGVGSALSVAGIFLLGSAAINLGKSAAFYLMGGNNDPYMKLWKLAYDMELRKMSTDVYGDTFGSIVDGCLGGLIDGIMSGIELFSDDVSKGRDMERDEIRQKLIDGSDNFGKWARGNLTNIIASSINIQTGEIDWSLVDQKFQAFISDETVIEGGQKMANTQIFKNAYDTLEYTGFLSTDAQEIKDLIGTNSSISYSSREALVKIAREEIQRNFKKEKARLERLSREIGVIRTEGGQTYMVPPESLTDTQKKRVEEELLPLNQNVMVMGAALEHLNAKK